MNKKIKYLSVLLIASLFFVGNVSAAKKITCKYSYAGARVNQVYKIELEVSGDKSSVKKVTLTETDIVSGKEITNKDLTKTYKKGVFNLKETDSCPVSVKITNNKIKKDTKNSGTHKTVSDAKDTSDIGATPCPNFTSETTCKSSTTSKCVWNSQYKLCSVDGNSYLSCGDAKDIPPIVPELISYAVNLLKIITPIILIIVGLVELVKAVASSNEDSMKKAQSKLIKKVVAAVMVFFVITIVQFVTLKVADSGDAGSIKACLKCFLNGTDDCDSIYVKDGYGMCYFKGGSSKQCSKIAE